MQMPYIRNKYLAQVLRWFSIILQKYQVSHLSEAGYYNPNLGVPVRLQEIDYKVYRDTLPSCIGQLQWGKEAIACVSRRFPTLARLTAVKKIFNVLVQSWLKQITLDDFDGFGLTYMAGDLRLMLDLAYYFAQVIVS
jgi:hypothetical protein